ncbi:hypothetical protein [Pedobacter steynii]
MKTQLKLPILFFIFFFIAINAFAQKEIFDITTFTAPRGWKKQTGESAIQFSKEDTAKGIYCLITLYKSVSSTAPAKENFDMAWASIVKEMVTVFKAPEMQPAETDAGWETHSGYAPFENEGNKGVVLLATSSAYSEAAHEKRESVSR